MSFTSSVRAEGDQPADPWWESTLYLAEHVTYNHKDDVD